MAIIGGAIVGLGAGASTFGIMLILGLIIFMIAMVVRWKGASKNET